MFGFQVLAGLLALASPLMVLADVTPSEPGPGSTFKAGSQCRLTWLADTDSTTAWNNMTIELMSGSNLNMVRVTTVTPTTQDGTKDGSFEYTCPDVTPNSAIYFYQFTSTHTANKTWTTRFTIQAANGSSTPPENADQPSGDKIPWGIGRLANPSSNSSLSSSSSGSFPLPSNTRLVVTPSSSLSSGPSKTPSASAGTATSGALANAVNDMRVWLALATFVVFL